MPPFLRCLPGRAFRVAVVSLVAAGCAPARSFLNEHLPPPGPEVSVVPRTPPPSPTAAGAVRPAGGQQPAAPEAKPATPARVDDFVRVAVGRNPRIARATIAIEAAQGRYTQAGLYPNPDLAVYWDEIGDRTGAGGVLNVPQITQKIVTGRKLSLSQAVAAKEVDQARLDLIAERYGVVAGVRVAFVEALGLQYRAERLGELVRLSDEALATGKTLLENKQIARLDLLQIEVEREQFAAQAAGVAKELPAAYRRLAAAAGDGGLAVPAVVGSYDSLPEYDLEQVRAVVLATHPDVRSARVAVERAQAAVRRAEAQPIPDVTVGGGFIRQFENKSYDGAASVALPLPLWDRNQGNIRAARAELGMAVQTVGRAENDLTTRVATAYQTYASARERAERYRVEILPRATEAYELSLKAFQGGQFEYLRVVAAQRAVAEAKLERNTAMTEAWKAAAELSGLLLEEAWPGTKP